MNMIYTKQHEAKHKWTGTICPKVKKKLDRHIEIAASCMVYPAGGGIFSVTDKYGTNIVDINVRSCDCRRWQLTGIPCCHAIACFRHDDIRPETMVHECYSIETYMQAYGYNIWPVRDKIHWEKMNGVDVQAPIYEKKVGRPARNRKKNPTELEGGTKLSKHGVMMHCSACGSSTHNKRTCHKYSDKNMTNPEGELEEYDDPNILKVRDV